MGWNKSPPGSHVSEKPISGVPRSGPPDVRRSGIENFVGAGWSFFCIVKWWVEVVTLVEYLWWNDSVYRKWPDLCVATFERIWSPNADHKDHWLWQWYIWRCGWWWTQCFLICFDIRCKCLSCHWVFLLPFIQRWVFMGFYCKSCSPNSCRGHSCYKYHPPTVPCWTWSSTWTWHVTGWFVLSPQQPLGSSWLPTSGLSSLTRLAGGTPYGFLGVPDGTSTVQTLYVPIAIFGSCCREFFRDVMAS